MDYRQYNIVTEPCRTMRALARQALKGRWLESFIFLIVIGAITSVPPMILDRTGSQILGFIASVYSLLITGPLSLGSAWYFLKLFRQRAGGLDDLKYGFSYAQKAIVLYIIMVVRIFLWCLLFIVPGIIAAIRYSMAFYILADDPSKDPSQCIAESCELMRGNKGKYVLLALSFIGWMILASIPSGSVQTALMPNMGNVNLNSAMDLQEYFNASLRVASSPLVFLASIPTYLVQAYQNTAYVCFYDLANGNLSIGNYDYAAANGRVEDPFTGEDVKFTDVPTEVVHDDLPETFDDPELKAAEDKYNDNIYGE
jgi:uncharacterized membrane protein